ncbi:hypothetical protein GCM10017608_01940 [Agromyces luteolus]|uniref:hypothetical protein n=1 Tax=Agromyces luteolus TaxID=88373 RepID=UPI00197AD6D3|nr:hypothetical protein [Agromyces luteolus]GLK26262.1 hypothetical protein GCM10017608_01940 [Agromyces luteolus]
MANLRVHNDRLEVHLTPAEKSLALRGADVIVQRDDIRSATITDDPWIWVRGIRRRGTEVPLVIAVGVWKTHSGSDFVLVKGKRQAVVLELSDGEFDRLVLSTSRAAELIDRLKVGAPDDDDVEAAAEAGAAGAAPDDFAQEETSGD